MKLIATITKFLNKDRLRKTTKNKLALAIILFAGAVLLIYLNKILFAIKNFLDFFIDINGGSNVSISDRIYLLTLLAIIWYTYETQKLREATLGRPVISIIKNVDDTIQIRNDGSNIAYNIEISFLYNNIPASKSFKIGVLGRGLFYKISISDKEITVDKNKNEKVKLSSLINPSPPDKKLKVIIDYSGSSDSLKNNFRDKWKPDETIIMTGYNEGRFRLIYSKPR